MCNQRRATISRENPTRYGQIWEKSFNIFFREKNLKESILIQNLVPFNFQEIKRMTEFMVQFYKQKNHKALLNQDSIYEKVQKKHFGCNTYWENYVMLWSEQIKRV